MLTHIDLLYTYYLCRYSSVVEHVIGNDGVGSPILPIGTSLGAPLWCFFLFNDQYLCEFVVFVYLAKAHNF